MHTVLWTRVKGVGSVLPIPFIGKYGTSSAAAEEDQVDQALRQVINEREELEEPLMRSVNAGRSAGISDTSTELLAGNKTSLQY
jgi:hypothetical protein